MKPFKIDLEKSNKTVLKINKEVLFNGTMKNLKDLAHEFDVKYDTLRNRLKKGMDIETALNKKVNKKEFGQYSKLKLGGKTLTIKQWAYMLDLHPQTIVNRKSKGLSNEKALARKKHERTKFV